MKRIILAIGLALSLGGGCVAPATVVPPAPGVFADKTVLDEKAAIGIELAYTAAAKGSATAIRSGLVTDPSVILRIGMVNEKAYAAVKAVRAAYKVGNAVDYAVAFHTAQVAITDITKAYSE